MAEPVAAVRWLVDQIRRCNTLPPELPREEARFYLLAAFCPDNRVLGFLIDTYRHYYRTRNRLGVLSCVRIVATANGEGYPHLNFLYNLMVGTVLREYRHPGSASGKNPDSTFLTDKDFRTLGRLLPDSIRSNSGIGCRPCNIKCRETRPAKSWPGPVACLDPPFASGSSRSLTSRSRNGCVSSGRSGSCVCCSIRTSRFGRWPKATGSICRPPFRIIADGISAVHPPRCGRSASR